MPTRIDRGAELLVAYTAPGYFRVLAYVFAVIVPVGLFATVAAVASGKDGGDIAAAALNTLFAAAWCLVCFRAWRTSALRISGSRVAFELKFRLGAVRKYECTVSDITGVRVAGSINWAHVFVDTRSHPLHISTIARTRQGKETMREVLDALREVHPNPPTIPDHIKRWFAL